MARIAIIFGYGLLASAAVCSPAEAQSQYYKFVAPIVGPAVNFLNKQAQPYYPVVQDLKHQYVYRPAKELGGWAAGDFRYQTTPQYVAPQYARPRQQLNFPTTTHYAPQHFPTYNITSPSYSEPPGRRTRR